MRKGKSLGQSGTFFAWHYVNKHIRYGGRHVDCVLVLATDDPFQLNGPL